MYGDDVERTLRVAVRMTYVRGFVGVVVRLTRPPCRPRGAQYGATGDHYLRAHCPRRRHIPVDRG